MKIGDKVEFYLFSVITEGVIYEIDKTENTISVIESGYKYTNVRTFDKLPKNKKEIPPWYILK